MEQESAPFASFSIEFLTEACDECRIQSDKNICLAPAALAAASVHLVVVATRHYYRTLPKEPDEEFTERMMKLYASAIQDGINAAKTTIP